MLVTILALFMLLFPTIGISESKRGMDFRDYHKLEKSFEAENEPVHKAELAYLLTFTPPDIQLENSTIYYAKYALKFERFLKVENICELNLLLGNYFQDIFSYDRADEYYKQIDDQCPVKTKEYVQMRLAWSDYSQKQKLVAYKKMQSINTKYYTDTIHTRSGYIWADLITSATNPKLIPLSPLENTHFQSGFLDFLREKREGLIPLITYKYLLQSFSNLSNDFLEKLFPEKKNICDLNFAKDLNDKYDWIKLRHIKECILTGNPDAKIILSIIADIKDITPEISTIQAQMLANTGNKQKACHAFKKSYFALENEDRNVLFGIQSNCLSSTEIRELITLKYLKNKTIDKIVINVLKKSFSLDLLKEYIKLKEIINSTDAFDLLVLNETQLDTETNKKLLKFVSSVEDQISLIGANIKIDISHVNNLCQLKPEENKRGLFYRGIIKLGKYTEYLQCDADFYLQDQGLLSELIDGLKFKPTSKVQFANLTVKSESDLIFLPKYTLLNPKSKFSSIRKELYLLESSKTINACLNDTINLTQELIYKCINEYKLLRQSISNHKWKTQNLYKLTITSFQEKIDFLIDKLNGTPFERKEIRNFLERLRNA